MLNQKRNRRTYVIMGFLALGLTIFSLNCGKKGEDGVQAQERGQSPSPPSQALQSQTSPSIASQEFSQALLDGKYVYLFFYEPGNTECETMERNLDLFDRKTKKNVEIIKIDRKDPKNSDFVSRLRAQTAPIPLTLLVNPNNALVAVFTKVVTEKELSQAFPSPKKTQALKYLQEGKGVILCFANKKMSSKKEVQACCSQAKDKLAEKAEYISIDLSDPKEAEFIKEMKIDASASEPVTFVINSQGQITGKYDGKLEVASLVQAATKVVKSGCCPPGSGQTCDSTQSKNK